MLQELQKTEDWLVTQERALHESTLSQRSTREEKEISQKSRASAFSGHLEISKEGDLGPKQTCLGLAPGHLGTSCSSS